MSAEPWPAWTAGAEPGSGWEPPSSWSRAPQALGLLSTQTRPSLGAGVVCRCLAGSGLLFHVRVPEKLRQWQRVCLSKALNRQKRRPCSDYLCK